MDTAVQPATEAVIPPPPPAVYSTVQISAALKHLENGIGRSNVPPMEHDEWSIRAQGEVIVLKAVTNELLQHRGRGEVAGEIVTQLRAALFTEQTRLNEQGDRIEELLRENERLRGKAATTDDEDGTAFAAPPLRDAARVLNDDDDAGEIPFGTPLQPPTSQKVFAETATLDSTAELQRRCLDAEQDLAVTMQWNKALCAQMNLIGSVIRGFDGLPDSDLTFDVARSVFDLVKRIAARRN